jgi:hypothetical protein
MKNLLVITALALLLLSSDAFARTPDNPGRGDRGDREHNASHDHPAPQPEPAAPAPAASPSAPGTAHDGPDTRPALRRDDACQWPFWQRTWVCKGN